MVEITANLREETVIETENAARLVLKYVEIRSRRALKVNRLRALSGRNCLRGYDGL